MPGGTSRASTITTRTPCRSSSPRAASSRPGSRTTRTTPGGGSTSSRCRIPGSRSPTTALRRPRTGFSGLWKRKAPWTSSWLSSRAPSSSTWLWRSCSARAARCRGGAASSSEAWASETIASPPPSHPRRSNTPRRTFSGRTTSICSTSERQPDESRVRTTTRAPWCCCTRRATSCRARATLGPRRSTSGSWPRCATSAAWSAGCRGGSPSRPSRRRRSSRTWRTCPAGSCACSPSAAATRARES
mmetsp:Transcript_51965/g.137254  ORF Transcript_51965/g.137254 Transcript_51965/m.137254 type:complete len:245 (+) Transcript_51965:514-1248(+)